MKQHTVTINGTVYDSATGKALHVERNSATAARHGAHSAHVQPQRSKTLNRRYVQPKAKIHVASEEPAVTAVVAPAATIIPRKKASHAFGVHQAPAMSDVRRSDKIVRFAKAPAQVQAHKTTHATHDIQHVPHPAVHRAEQKLAAKQPVERTVKPSHIIKRDAIEHATAQMPAKHTRKEVTHHKQRSKFSRFVSVGSASLAVLLLGAYLTYLNMPALSTRVAATQAGIEATYPSYQPMGYSLNGPVAYKEGSVSMKFAANGGPENYTLAQTKSGWDSSAVLEYFVKPKAGVNYTTTTANGLTIYTYGDNSAWVNNGILYTINGDTTLSNSQIQRIATSL